MCRSLKNGQRRRCPACSSFPAAARANGSRRQGRLARRKVVDHLNSIGLVDTATAVLASPPSMLAPFMAAAGLDPAILGDVPMPGTGPKGADAAALIKQANDERAQQHRRAAQQAAAVCATPSVVSSRPRLARAAAPQSVHAGAAARLAVAMGRGPGARRPGAAPAAANVPNCKKNVGLLVEWEDSDGEPGRASKVFAEGGSKAQCRIACAEAEMLCKGCPLMESCAQDAKDSHYTGIAGGRIFVNGRHRLTPSSPARIVA
ncbi:hypothetical protein BVC93_31210 (plasmid) [Mycobacterium sp. MS1601]|uniref:hypothetical protein n=1 Tax=Mycobacterium sp. MS1601 TaxID=1936029 RepID=UPI000979847B|nr:hypothetical protein [Mycobacterium sp. MS1601]AQA06968.1 hypothetical protein BVC93_31210 [Mycobacterium sp. MS1601]